MNQYAVILLGDEREPDEIRKALQSIDPSVFDFYASRGVYFARFSGTAQQLAERIGFVKEHGAKLGIVIGVGQNYGFANADLWNWMRQS